MSEGQDAGGSGGQRSWAERLDLDRTTAIKTFVDRMEEQLRAIDAACEDLKAISREAKEAAFTPRHVKAMKKIATLRKDDKRGAAQEELQALELVGRAANFDLFDWAGGS